MISTTTRLAWICTLAGALPETHPIRVLALDAVVEILRSEARQRERAHDGARPLAD